MQRVQWKLIDASGVEPNVVTRGIEQQFRNIVHCRLSVFLLGVVFAHNTFLIPNGHMFIGFLALQPETIMAALSLLLSITS